MDATGTLPLLGVDDPLYQISDYTLTMKDRLDGAWTLLPMTNGWSNFGSTYTPPQYRLVGGSVELNGLAKGTQGVVIATLPVGFRPTGTLMNPTVGAVGGVKGFYAVDIDTAGTLKVAGTSVMNYVSLTGIVFPIGTLPPL